MLSRDDLLGIVRELAEEVAVLKDIDRVAKDRLDLFDKAYDLLREKSGYNGHIINCIETLVKQRDEALAKLKEPPE